MSLFVFVRPDNTQAFTYQAPSSLYKDESDKRIAQVDFNLDEHLKTCKNCKDQYAKITQASDSILKEITKRTAIEYERALLKAKYSYGSGSSVHDRSSASCFYQIDLIKPSDEERAYDYELQARINVIKRDTINNLSNEEYEQYAKISLHVYNIDP